MNLITQLRREILQTKEVVIELDRYNLEVQNINVTLLEELEKLTSENRGLTKENERLRKERTSETNTKYRQDKNIREHKPSARARKQAKWRHYVWNKCYGVPKRKWIFGK